MWSWSTVKCVTVWMLHSVLHKPGINCVCAFQETCHTVELDDCFLHETNRLIYIKQMFAVINKLYICYRHSLCLPNANTGIVKTWIKPVISCFIEFHFFPSHFTSLSHFPSFYLSFTLSLTQRNRFIGVNTQFLVFVMDFFF